MRLKCLNCISSDSVLLTILFCLCSLINLKLSKWSIKYAYFYIFRTDFDNLDENIATNLALINQNMAKKDNVDLLTSDVDALRSRMSDVENSVVNLRTNGGSSSSQDENRLSRIEGNVTFTSIAYSFTYEN